MDVGPLVKADAQAAKLAQPRERPLHDPAPSAQATPVRGAAHGQPGYDVTRSETLPNPCGVIAAIPEHAVRMPSRPPTFALEWGNRIDQSQRFFGSRSGWRRSGGRQAELPARRKSDDAWSQAWPDR